jgi:hypothetical protein
MHTISATSDTSPKRLRQRYARRHRKCQRQREQQLAAQREDTAAAAREYLLEHHSELTQDLDRIDYDAPRPDPWAALPPQDRAAMARAEMLRRARRLRNVERTTYGMSAVRPLRIRGCSGRHESRPGHRAAPRSRVGASSGAGRDAGTGGGSGGGGSGDDGGGGDPPGESPSDGDGGGDVPSGDFLWLAAHVEELFPEVLTASRFDVTVDTFLFDLDADERSCAKARIFNTLPARLRFTIFRDLVASKPRPWMVGSSCVFCRESLEPSDRVDGCGVCTDCWAIPEDHEDGPDLVRVGTGTFVVPRASDHTSTSWQSHNPNGGVS